MTFDFTQDKADFSRSYKWAYVENVLGHAATPDTLPMWLAQMDFAPAPVLQDALTRLMDAGEYGYFSGLETFRQQVAWWYQTRFGWSPDPAHILPTHGIGNAIGLTFQALTEPGDGIVIFTPVYNEFTSKTQRNSRTVVESPMTRDAQGHFQLDLDTLDTQMTGREKIMLISSPHNPAGRVWTVAELTQMADFCDRHDMLLVSDEIHMDLVFPGHTQVPTALAVPQVIPRLIVMSAASKTFDIAGLRTGYVIIPDDALRARFTKLHSALDIQPNRAGLEMTIAAYSPEGAAWVDALLPVLADNARRLSEGLGAMPGVRVMPMQGTFLAWIDFERTGMNAAEIRRRVQSDARIAASPGPIFGTGGETAIRLNIGTTPARMDLAIARLQDAFADLQ